MANSKKKQQSNRPIYLLAGVAVVLLIGFLVWRQGDEVGINQIMPASYFSTNPLSTASPRPRPSAPARVTIEGAVSKNSTGQYFLTTTADQRYELVTSQPQTGTETIPASGKPIPQPLMPARDGDTVAIDLEKYVGKKVSVIGRLSNNQLIVDRIRIVY